MVKKFFIALITILVCMGSASAEKVALVVQSAEGAKYGNALKGIKSTLDHKIVNIVLTSYDLIDIKKEIERNRPELIVAIGQDALKLVKNVEHIPVGYLLAINPDVVGGRKNFFGVTVNLNQFVQFKLVSKLLPLSKKIGLIYNPENTEIVEEEILSVTQKTGHKVVFKPITNPRKVAPVLLELADKVDAVWLYPDVSLLTAETVEFLFLFSLENQIPIISNESRFVFKGTSISIDADEYDSGVKLGLMAKKILNGDRLQSSKVDPEIASVKLNSRLIRMIDIKIDTDVRKNYGN